MCACVCVCVYGGGGGFSILFISHAPIYSIFHFVLGEGGCHLQPNVRVQTRHLPVSALPAPCCSHAHAHARARTNTRARIYFPQVQQPRHTLLARQHGLPAGLFSAGAMPQGSWGAEVTGLSKADVLALARMAANCTGFDSSNRCLTSCIFF